MWHEQMMGSWPIWGMFLGWMVWIAFIVISVAVIVRITKGSFKDRQKNKNIPFEGENNQERAEEILERRFAQGELNSQEFNEKMDQIRQHRHPAA